MELTESRQRVPLTHICYQPFNVREAPSQALTDLYERVLLAGGMAIPMSDDEVNSV